MPTTKKKSADCPIVEYIIVGAGTSACVLARYLSDNFNNRVVVFEQGQNHTGDPVVENGLLIFQPPSKLSEITFDPKYSISKDVPDDFNGSILGDTLFFETYSSGTGGGGSSAHNYLLAVRGTPGVYDQWAEISGNPIWSFNELLPIMKGLETYHSDGVPLDPTQRGTTGPLQITQTPPVDNDPVAQAISRTLGIPIVGDYNLAQNVDVVASSQNYTFPDGRRSYSYNAFLPPSVVDLLGHGVDGRQLQILFDTTVTRVLFKTSKKTGRPRAIGVEYVNRDKSTHRLFAKKFVILSAGAPLSAAILERSGIGPRAVLEAQGIPIVVANETIGTNLFTQFGSVAAFTNPPAEPVPSPTLIAFTDGSPFVQPTSQRMMQLILATFMGINAIQRTLLLPFDGPWFGAIGWILNPASRGTSHIVSPDPFVLPDVRYNIYQGAGAADLPKVIAFYQQIRAVAHNLSQTMIYPPESHFETPSLLEQDARASLFNPASVTSHFTGTVQMGTSPENGGVDGNLRVFGVDHLMVADNSIPPVPEDGNTAWQAYTIGAVAAKILGATVPTA
jgi:choline dehydrogenase-like flavoprotein